MNGHDDARDSLAVYALGVLPEAEAVSVRDAMRADPALREEFAELLAAVDVIGYAAEAGHSELDELASARLKRRILSVVRAPAGSGLSMPETIASGRNRPWLASGIAAAAVVVAAASYARQSSLQSQIAADRIAFARAQTADQAQIALAAEQRRNLATILDEHAKHFPIAHGDVIVAQGRLFLAFSKLGPLPAGKVYQAWTIVNGHAPAPGATFVPQGDVTVVALGAPQPGVDAVALTVEPAGGSKKPSTTPSFVRRLD